MYSIANVIIKTKVASLDRIFDYCIPEELITQVAIGKRVLVPFGQNQNITEAYVMGISHKTELEIQKLKSIINVVDDVPVLSDKTIKLAKWMAKRYVCSLSMVLNLVTPSSLKLTKAKDGRLKSTASEKTTYSVSLNVQNNEVSKYLNDLYKRASKKTQVLKYLKDNNEVDYQIIKEHFNINFTYLKGLRDENLITITEKSITRAVYNPEDFSKTNDMLLTEEQLNAVNFISSLIDEEKYNKALIHGVTGSGKTEVYLQLIRKVIAKGKQCIVLVPEISLTPQMIERFVSRFGNMVAVLHSKLSNGQKFDQWKLIKENKVQIVIGARSAIFAPCENIGLIIIDEEHETSYKSNSTPRYDALEVAEALGSLHRCTLLLGSATPSLESYFEAKNGKMNLVELSKRANNKPMPEVNIIDMRQELKSGNMSMFSNVLLKEIKATIEKNEQVILFLNQRGCFTFVSCRECGHVMKCPHCDVSLKYHSHFNKLKCHYCGYEESTPQKCPSCGSSYIRFFGCGTQRIENEIQKIIPGISVIRMDTDTTRKKGTHELILKEFVENKIDVLVGTQMIAKGLDIPNVTLVGVITADTILNIEDFRSSERCYQLLEQVSGRAGRGDKTGKVIIQTYNPEHYSLKCAENHDYKSFFKNECMNRKIMCYPPYSRLVSITASGSIEEDVIRSIENVNNFLTKHFDKSIIILGPTPCGISKISDNYRWRLIIKTQKLNKVLEVLNALRNDIITNKIYKQIFIDIDVNSKEFI